MSEVWLSGSVEGVPPELLPHTHAMLQAVEDIPPAIEGLTTEQIWLRAGGAASLGFHLQHLAGSLGRLLTYARGEQLNPDQIAAARIEQEAGSPPRDANTMRDIALKGLNDAVEVMRRTPASTLGEAREVGRARKPSTVAAILFHCAEHAQRHSGQIVSTAKIIRGLNLRG